jgi:fused-like protein
LEISVGKVTGFVLYRSFFTIFLKCSHSDRFYVILKGYVDNNRRMTLLDLLSKCCDDSDPNTRKFASFAGMRFKFLCVNRLSVTVIFLVGNAAFHSKELYRSLASCLPALNNCLLDTDEKTRANSAGAIGNLVRNSGELCGHIGELSTISALMKIVLQDKDITTQVRNLKSFVFLAFDTSF